MQKASEDSIHFYFLVMVSKKVCAKYFLYNLAKYTFSLASGIIFHLYLSDNEDPGFLIRTETEELLLWSLGQHCYREGRRDHFWNKESQS